MNVNVHRKGELGALLLTLVLIVFVLFSAGCATGLRKSLSVTTTAAEESVGALDAVCMRYAKEWCQTDPCPKLETCKAAMRHLTDGAAAFVLGAKKANEVIRD